MNISEYRFNPETKAIESIPFDPKQSLPPTVENFVLLKHDKAKFFVDGSDVSNLIYRKISKIYGDPSRHKEEITWQSIRALITSQSRKPYLITNNAIKLLKEGFAVEDIAKTLNVPVETVKKWHHHLKTPSPTVGVKHNLTEDQRNDMRKFIKNNRSKMTNKEIAKTLGISQSFIWVLLNPEKSQKNEENQKFRKENGLVKPRKQKEVKSMKKKPTLTSTIVMHDLPNIPIPDVTPNLPVVQKETVCRRCEQFKAEKTITDNQLRQSIEMMDKVKEHYENQTRELKEDLLYFKSLVNKVIK